MRVLLLVGVSALALASCDSPYGKDFSKPDVSNYAVGTGSHIRGASTGSTVSSTGADALDSVTHSSNSTKNTLGGS